MKNWTQLLKTWKSYFSALQYCFSRPCIKSCRSLHSVSSELCSWEYFEKVRDSRTQFILTLREMRIPEIKLVATGASEHQTEQKSEYDLVKWSENETRYIRHRTCSGTWWFLVGSLLCTELDLWSQPWSRHRSIRATKQPKQTNQQEKINLPASFKILCLKINRKS